MITIPIATISRGMFREALDESLTNAVRAALFSSALVALPRIRRTTQDMVGDREAVSVDVQQTGRDRVTVTVDMALPVIELRLVFDDSSPANTPNDDVPSPV